MRVLHLIESLGLGGAERRLLNDATRLHGQFEQTVVYLFTDETLAGSLRVRGIPTIGLNLRGLADARAFARIRRLIHDLRPDLIHTQLFGADCYGRVVGRCLGIPVISTIQSSWYDDPEPFHFSLKRRWLDRLTVRIYSQQVIAVSEFVKQTIQRHLRLPLSRIHVIPNAVDPQPYEQVDMQRVAALRQTLEIPPDVHVLMTVGKLQPPKGHRYGLEAMARRRGRSPRWYWILVGDGVGRPDIEREVERLGLQDSVRFLGIRQDIPELLALSDLFVFPSTSAEGLPFALLEAMAAGKACVGFRMGPTPEVIDDGVTGLLAEPRSAASLAEAIETLLADPHRREQMGRAGRQRVHEHFHADEAARQLGELYRMWER